MSSRPAAAQDADAGRDGQDGPSEGAVRPRCPAGMPRPPPRARRAGTRPPHRRLRTRPRGARRAPRPVRPRSRDGCRRRGTRPRPAPGPPPGAAPSSPGVIRLCSSFMLYPLLFPWAETPAVRAAGRLARLSPRRGRPPAAARQPGRGLLPLDHLLEVASRRASPGAPPPGSTSAMPTPDPGPSHFTRVRRMSMRATTMTGTTTWRVGPQGLRFRGGGGVLPRRGRSSVRGAQQPASGRRRGPEPAPGRRALPGPAPCAATGDLFAKAYETCGRRGAGALRPGVSTYSLPCPLPSHGPCLSRADSGRRAGTRRPRAEVLLCRAGTATGSGSRDCASWQPPAAQAPTDRSDSTATTTSTEGVTWICSRCSVPWTRTSIDLARARAAFVAGHGPQVVAERRRPGPGCRPGRDRRRAPGAAA